MDLSFVKDLTKDFIDGSSVGMGKQAVDAFIKCNNIAEAIATCVSLNQWHDAVELVTKYNQPTQVTDTRCEESV